MSAEVFVSYSSQDHSQVRKIVDRLRDAGISVWMDEGGIDAATLWSEAIVEAINECKVLIMMVSRHSTDSANVVKEVMLASESSKIILPVYLEPADIPTRLKYQLTGIQHSESYNLTPDELFDELARGLAKNGVMVPGYDVNSTPVSNSNSHRKKRGNKHSWHIPTMIAMTVTAFILGLFFSGLFKSNSKSETSVTNDLAPTKRLKLDIPGDENIPAGADNPFPWGGGRSITISPSGRYLGYYTITNNIKNLNILDLNNFSDEKKLISSSLELLGIMFSPDNKWIAFFDKEKIKKVLIETGEATIIGETRVPNYGYWADDGYIYYVHSLGRKLSRIKDIGSSPELLHEGPHQEGATLGKPYVVSGGKGVILAFPGKGINRNYAPIKYLDLNTKEIKELGVSGIWPYYHQSGYLLFARNGNIWACPFDLDSLSVGSNPVPIVNGISMNAIWESANYSVSESGSIVYLEGRDESQGIPAWVDLEGNVTPTGMPEQLYGISEISPDGKKIAIQIATEKDDIWIYDTENWQGSRLTNEGSNGWPLWSKDGSGVVYVSRPLENEEWSLYSKKLNSIGSPEQIWEPAKGLIPGSWHPSNDLMALNLESDIWFIDFNNTKPSGEIFAGGDYLEWVGLFSPDGNWLSYSADKQGIYHIYIQSLKEKGVTYQISGDNKGEVLWAPNGNSLYYFESGGNLLTAEFDSKNSSNPIGEEKKLFYLKYIDNPGNSYDVHPNGKKFLFVVPKKPYKKIRDIRLILNLKNELKNLF